MGRYVFPDGNVVPISTALRTAAESSGLEVRDVEALREHYVLTLRHWVRAARGGSRGGSPGDGRDALSDLAAVHGGLARTPWRPVA